jgi:hypothetical protein
MIYSSSSEKLIRRVAIGSIPQKNVRFTSATSTQVFSWIFTATHQKSATIEPMDKSSGSIALTDKQDARAKELEEIWAKIDAQFGSWADREDITDNWVEKMREESDERLRDILDPPLE